MRKKRILVVVNKSWECKPFMDAVKKCGLIGEPFIDLTEQIEAKEVPGEERTPEDEERMKYNYTPSCRAEYHLDTYDVMIRCIQDLMDDPAKGKSNSGEKYCVLPRYIAADDPDLVISVSTAESTPIAQAEGGTKDPETVSKNGCVIVGGQYYMYDAGYLDKSSHSALCIEKFDIYRYDNRIFEAFHEAAKTGVCSQFLKAPNHPAAHQDILASPDYGCVGVVNVEDYTVYPKADPAAYEAYDKDKEKYPPMSIETTHGIVRMSTPDDIPVVFVSPIVDRYHKFSEDVQGDQNYNCAYNSGIAVAAFLAEYRMEKIDLKPHKPDFPYIK